MELRCRLLALKNPLSLPILLKGIYLLFSKYVKSVANFGEGVESEESDKILLTKVSAKDASHEETVGERDDFQDSCTSGEAVGATGVLYHCKVLVAERISVRHWIADSGPGIDS